MKIAKISIKKKYANICVNIKLSKTLATLLKQAKENDLTKKVVLNAFQEQVFNSFLREGNFLFEISPKNEIESQITTLISYNKLNTLSRELGNFFKNLYLDYVKSADIVVNVEINKAKKQLGEIIAECDTT